ncbi:putative glycerol-3-phosphate dehydrogenase, mitochondrial [Thelohanellus kitauei]|uniref:glycerol-3-phosphate dehydrogenase n=1 Tax=Thelohanellus kitauei TaxID=669202 RepID=A0A0C2IEF6_THEKT|nr:putative glycerol-3-phosphate dehydrogenase, mitochondrial [Thelohanellus kitauei]
MFKVCHINSSPFDYMLKKICLAMYELISRDAEMMCKYVSKTDVNQMFPFLNLGKWSCGIMCYDGQFDDARMNLTVIKTAILNGASVCNYLNVENVKKIDDIYELTIFDKETQKVFTAKAKFVVNATGPNIDGIRKMIEPLAQEICVPSTGIHLSTSKNITYF